MAKFTLLLFACLFGNAHAMAHTAACQFKIGGMLHADKYTGAKEAFKMAMSWANTMNKTYALNLTHIMDYNASTLASTIAMQTMDGSVHAIVCPYTSGASKICVDAVNASFKGPILVWGGADDAIFTDHCMNKHCIGTFTPASNYMTSGLDAADATSEMALSVVTIVNDNDFSRSVLTGAESRIMALGNTSFMHVKNVQLGAKKDGMLSKDDKMEIQKAMDMKPDVVLLLGHAGDVPPTVEVVGMHSHTPKFIMGTNSLGDYSVMKYKTCVVMPTQWDSTSMTVDPVIGWNSSTFDKELKDKNHSSTYHTASAGGAAVALINALEAAMVDNMCTGEAVATAMKNLNIDSFYGKLKFNVNGSIEKPMYMVQSMDTHFVNGTTLSHPLSKSACWGTATKCPFKVGGMVKNTSYGAGAKKAFDMAAEWAMSMNKSYEVDLSMVMDYDGNTTAMTQTIMQQTSDMSVHAILCPYTSGASKVCVDAVNSSFKGPILVWGGAADDIFTEKCAGKHCFGTFTPASQYMASALMAADKSDEAALKVLLIVNNNDFSKSVLAGAMNTIEMSGGNLTVAKTVYLSLSKSDEMQTLSTSDMGNITAGMDMMPDVVAVIGHANDVQPTIEYIGQHSHSPAFVFATNSVGVTYTVEKYSKCVVMPTQWDSMSKSVDPLIGWDSATFKSKINLTSLSYHVASAGGAAVGLMNALEHINTATQCSANDVAMKMAMLNIPSFYGMLKWNENGAIEKPMYMVQDTKDGYVNASTMKMPMDDAMCWGPKPTPAPTEAPTEAPTQAPTEAPTEAPTQAAVSVQYVIANLNYSAVNNNATLKSELSMAVKSATLASLPAAYTADDLTVVFSSGSLKADVTIMPKGSDTADSITTTVTNAKATMDAAVTTQVKAVPGVDQAVESGRTLDEVATTSTVTSPTPAPPVAADGAAPILSHWKASAIFAVAACATLLSL